MSFSDYLESAVLGHVFSSTTLAKPTVYVALFTAAPSDTGGGTEVTGGSYARQALGSGTVSGTSPTQVVNAADIVYPTATADWTAAGATPIGWAATFDAATGGNMLDWAPLASTKTIASGDQFKFLAGQFKITLD